MVFILIQMSILVIINLKQNALEFDYAADEDRYVKIINDLKSENSMVITQFFLLIYSNSRLILLLFIFRLKTCYKSLKAN